MLGFVAWRLLAHQSGADAMYLGTLLISKRKEKRYGNHFPRTGRYGTGFSKWIAGELQPLLSDLIDLALQGKQIH
jgi:hypothetical protein